VQELREQKKNIISFIYSVLINPRLYWQTYKRIIIWNKTNSLKSHLIKTLSSKSTHHLNYPPETSSLTRSDYSAMISLTSCGLLRRKYMALIFRSTPMERVCVTGEELISWRKISLSHARILVSSSMSLSSMPKILWRSFIINWIMFSTK